MRLRFLTAAALASMLAAAGCGGGGAGSSSVLGITPKAPIGGNGSGTAAKGRANISALIKIPLPYTPKAAASKSTGRGTQYLSPGTVSFDVLLGNCGNGTGASQITTTENQVDDNFAGAVPATSPSITFGVQTTANVPLLQPGVTILIRDSSSLPGTAFVSSSFLITSVVTAGSLITGHFVDANGTSTPVPNTAGTYAADPNTTPAGTAGSHYFPIGSEIDLAAPATTTNQKFIIGGQPGASSGTGAPQALTPTLQFSGTVPQTISGVAGTTYTVNGTSNINTSGTAPGFYTMNVQIANVLAGAAPGTKYCLGIVTLDSAGYVLSEAQQEYDVPSTGGTVETAFTLKPVVNSFITANPTLVVPNPLGSVTEPDFIVDVNGNNPGQNNQQTGNSGQTQIQPNGRLNLSYNAYSTVLFATDHAGFVIPEIGLFPNSNSLPANSPIGNLPQNQAGPLLNTGVAPGAGAVDPFVNISSYNGSPATLTALVEYFTGVGPIPFLGSGLPTTAPTTGIAQANTATTLINPTFSPIDSVTLGGFTRGNNAVDSAQLESVFGTYITNVTDPSPGTVISADGVGTGTTFSNSSAGTPLYLVCNSQAASVPYVANVNFKSIVGTVGTATFNDNTGTGNVAGFTYNPTNAPTAAGVGQNLPLTSTIAAPVTIPLGAINCTPGIGAIVN